MSVDKRGRTYRAYLKAPAGNSPTCLTTGVTPRPSPWAFAAANPGSATFSPAPTPATRTIGLKPTSQPWPPSAADSSPPTTPNGPPNPSTPPSDSPLAAKATPYAATRKTPYHPRAMGARQQPAATLRPGRVHRGIPRRQQLWFPRGPTHQRRPHRPPLDHYFRGRLRHRQRRPHRGAGPRRNNHRRASLRTRPAIPPTQPRHAHHHRPTQWGSGQRIPARRHPTTAPVPHPKPTHCRPQLRHRHHSKLPGGPAPSTP